MHEIAEIPTFFLLRLNPGVIQEAGQNGVVPPGWLLISMVGMVGLWISFNIV